MLVTTQWPLKRAATSPHLFGFVFYGCLESLTELSVLCPNCNMNSTKLPCKQSNEFVTSHNQIAKTLGSTWIRYDPTHPCQIHSLWGSMYFLYKCKGVHFKSSAKCHSVQASVHTTITWHTEPNSYDDHTQFCIKYKIIRQNKTQKSKMCM